MKLDPKTTFVDRWKALEQYARKGNRYLFIMTDGDRYEAEYRVAYNGEPDVEISVKNVRDLSEHPRFDGVERLILNLSELAEILPAQTDSSQGTVDDV